MIPKIVALISLIIFYLIPLFTKSQDVYSLSPSLKVMGLGGSLTSIDGDISTVHSNPAGLAQLKGLDINFSNYAMNHKFYNFDNKFYGIAFKTNGKYIVGISYQTATYNNYYIQTYQQKFLTLTGAVKLPKNYALGLNFNIAKQMDYNQYVSPTSIDLGLTKKIPIQKTINYNDQINIGLSINNFFYPQLLFVLIAESSSYYESIGKEIISHFGISYQFEYDKKLINKNLKTLSGLFLVDSKIYTYNRKNLTTNNCGFELTFLEVFSPRLGYAIQKDIVYLNYGFGLHLPIHKFYKVPVNIHFDYGSSNLKVQNVSLNDYYNGVSLRVNWLLK